MKENGRKGNFALFSVYTNDVTVCGFCMAVGRHDIQHNDTQHKRLICDTEHK